jgi:hypothetical protein
MPSQTLTFVVLPREPVAGAKLSLSVLLTPRLAGAASLASFPDLVNWPQQLLDHGLRLTFDGGGTAATVPIPVSQLRPDIWQRLFTPQTYVDAHEVPDLTQNLFVSYPVRDALAYLKFAYQTVALGSASLQRGLSLILGPLSFRDGDKSTLDAELAQLRVTMFAEQQAFLHPTPVAEVIHDAGTRTVLPPDGVASVTTMPADPHDTASRFALFHRMPPAPGGPPPPSTPQDLAKLLDFHRALTALSAYPDVMRALGLVFDLEIPAGVCATSPTGDSYRSIALTKVAPGAPWQQTPTLSLPGTSYVLGNDSFSAAPATPPTTLETGTVVPGDVVDGVLVLGQLDFSLLQVDLDGGMLKALTLADNAANAGLAAVADALPSLRSSGIGLIAGGRAQQFLKAVAANVGFDSQLSSGVPPGPFSAVDLNRGYRLDVWSSRTGHWHSLHRRNASYRFGASGDAQMTLADEEGMLHPSVAQPAPDPTRPTDTVASANGVPQPSTDIYVHERVASWQGWSLSATRPGGVLNRDVDPGKATEADPTLGQPLTPFKMTSSYSAVPGSLPLLRFGDRYRMRARAVDLAGNSIPAASESSGAAVLPAGDAALIYQRFDPVTPPLVVLQSEPGPGGSLERLVIRSRNTSPELDQAVSTEVDRRHVAPPPSAVRLVEQHGVLDDASGHLRGDAALYEMIVARDRAEIPVVDGVPLEPGPLIDVSYLPDPFAAGAAMRDLPGAPDDSSADSTDASFAYRTLPDVQPRAGSVTHLDFGTAWPDRRPLVLAIAEGGGAPQWDPAQRVLTVSLPKATDTEVTLSSYLREPDLELMGVWGWIREIAEASEASAMLSASADAEVPLTGDVLALLVRLALEGGHELITPSRTLALVHAVQQPIGEPTFVQLPVVHRPAQPILASALRNSFTPITAWRIPGSHAVALLGGLKVHGASTVKVELEGTWREVLDDPSQPAPTDALQRDHVQTIPLASTDAGPVYSDASQTVAVGVYVPRVDTLWFSAPFDDLEGVATPTEVAAPQHHLADTKHRWIAYRATSTSRFEECFGDDSLDYTRTGPPLIVDVPSSARPSAPDVAYVVPTFGWERQESTNLKSSVRFGNGLRVYLNRPWWSSGADELLGVVLWPGSQAEPDYATRELLKPYFTQWGADPIWASGDLSPVPVVGDFTDAVQGAEGLELLTGMTVDVAGHTVQYDAARKLWFCDIQFVSTPAYAPFVRLALARYQPHSIPGVELSSVVLADFAQLAPTRSAVVTIDPADPRRARVFVGGLAPRGPTRSIVEVTVEARRGDVQTDLGWQPAPAAAVTVTEDQPPPSSPDAVLWMGSVSFPTAPAPGAFRVVVREYEVLPADGPAVAGHSSAGLPATAILDERRFAKRLVYAAFLNYDYGVSA